MTDRSDSDTAQGLEQWLGRRPTDEEIAEDRDRRRARRLQPLAGNLPIGVEEEHRKLAEKYPEQTRSGVRAVDWGIRSPKASDELLALDDTELLTFLRNAELGHELVGPSMEGLGDAIAGASTDQPDRLSALAGDFAGLDPILISGLLRGLESAARNGTALHWAEVLRLCTWVVEQPRAIPGRETRWSDLDPGWVWTRRQIASLILYGIESKNDPVPVELHAQVWSILRALADDPDPEDARDQSSEPSAVAINSVRGEAIRAIIAYALWLRRSEDSMDRLDTMPDVKKVLERHLDPAVDASPAIRSVYGQLLPALMWLDREWVRASLNSIFPRKPTMTHLRKAAWETYVRFQNPTAAQYAVLEAEYQRAVDDLADIPIGGESPESPGKRLAEHLMILAWTGAINPVLPGGIIERFFRAAPSALRSRAIQFIGVAVDNTEGAVPSEYLARMRTIWDHRLGAAMASNDAFTYQEEIASFGWWFASRKFEVTWSLEELRKTLQVAGGIDAEYQVYERLAELAERYPLEVMKCLDLLLGEGQRPRWSVDLSSEHVGMALQSALASANREARALANEIVSRLSTLGFTGYLDLLE